MTGYGVGAVHFGWYCCYNYFVWVNRWIAYLCSAV